MRAGCLVSSLILLLPATGCSRQHAPTAPQAAAVVSADSSAGSGDVVGGVPDLPYRFPLVIGNHWRYAVHLAAISVPRDTSQLPWITDYRYTMDARLRGWAVIGGRDYVDEERTFDDSTGWRPEHVYLREDRAGLYEMSLGRQFYPTARALDVLEAGPSSGAAKESFRAARVKFERTLNLVAGAPAGGFAGPRDAPDPPELTRLIYPMRPGMRWWLPTVPPVAVDVEAFETVSLPAGRFPAWRTRYRIEWLGPEDYIRVWYGPDGFLALAVHQVFEGPYGRSTFDYTKQLEWIDLVGKDERP
jgi:hypothetical protein